MSFVDGISPTRGRERVEDLQNQRNQRTEQERIENRKKTKEEYQKPKNEIDFTI